jgi:AcrR family transcriptional regulator
LILEAAGRSFAEVGFEGATLEQISADVGLAPSSLYYYVASKEDLLAQLVVSVIEDIKQEVQARSAGSTDPVERLRAFLRAHLHVVTGTTAGVVVARHQDVLLSEAMTRTTIGQARREHEGQLEALLVEGVSAKVFRPVNARVMARHILGALNATPRWFHAESRDSGDEVADELLDLVVNGLQAPGHG